ncbi:sensor histidine kinase [Flavobacterium olei]|uniref:sensor histidine kinase n=1 Tax=Flavobacterium olei TaxID=1886782 RepID=UPI00321C1BBF
MEKTLQIQKLKKQLSEEVQKEHSDNNIILSLSNSIANLDDNQVRFSIDAGLIDRLGRELVARQETAVSELVKNSYDADSQEVTLSFIDSDSIGGTLRIQDDGDGMTRDELVNGFMRISSTDKIHNPLSRTYKRTRAGQKGIGRFAVQRLGNKLTIITQTSESESALMLSIDWNEYIGDINLSSISNSLKLIPKKREKGTTLIISGLRERWSEAAIQRIFNYVTDIIQPFALTERKKIDDKERIDITNDPGFKSKFVKIVNNVPKTIKNEILQFHSHALAIIEGEIDDTGIGLYSIESDKLNINEIGQIGNNPDNNQIPFDKLKNVKFRAYYFIHDSDLVPKMQATKIKKLAQTQGGIRLYRNGFRVLPYGEPSNDWLKLDKSLRTRSILPSHGNNNFFGFVELIDRENNFNETSSREGLSENDALIQLENFVYRTIITGVIKVAEVRNVKITTSQSKDEDGNWGKIEFRIQNIAHTLEELDRELENESGGIEAKKQRKKRVKQVQDAIKEIEKIQKEEQELIIKERSMLRVLSSVGLTIAQFIHEIKYYMDNIQSDIRYLLERLQDDKLALERITILDENFSSFHTYTSYFDNVVSQNVIRELRPLDLRRVVEPFRKSITNDALKSGIQFVEPIYNKYRIFTKPMHPSEWSSILFNFYTNSKKAIKRANSEGKILIECGEFEDKVYLEFSDNGDGISTEDEEKVFDEFFTTTSPNNFENTNDVSEILGTGLGLKIVKDIIKSYRGNVYVVSAKGDYSTCIRVELPKATEKDLEKYGL